jgi:hypothetical protein
MKNLARSIAIFLITTYIDAIYLYASSTQYLLCTQFLVGASLLAKAVWQTLQKCRSCLFASRLAPTRDSLYWQKIEE